MRSSETSPGNARPQSSIPRLRREGRRLRCSSHTSNASLGWDGYDCEAHAASRMNLLLQQPPKTFGNWPNLSRWYPPQDKKAVPSQSAQQNMYRAHPQRTKSNDFFNKISPKPASGSPVAMPCSRATSPANRHDCKLRIRCRRPHPWCRAGEVGIRSVWKYGGRRLHAASPVVVRQREGGSWRDHKFLKYSCFSSPSNGKGAMSK